MRKIKLWLLVGLLMWPGLGIAGSLDTWLASQPTGRLNDQEMAAIVGQGFEKPQVPDLAKIILWDEWSRKPEGGAPRGASGSSGAIVISSTGSRP